MRAAGNLAGVTFLSPPQYHPDQEQWREIITESGYFFTADSMRFFSSRILWDTLRSSGRTFLFITSERDEYSGQPRKYTIRDWSMSEGVDTLSDFCEFDTRAEALRSLGRIARSNSSRIAIPA